MNNLTLKDLVVYAREELDIQIMYAQQGADDSLPGIHVTNPNLDQIAQALDSAESQSMPRVIIHKLMGGH